LTLFLPALSFCNGHLLSSHLAIDQVASTVRQEQPDILFSASIWTSEEAKNIREIAEIERPGIRTHTIPQGLQMEKGLDAVVEYLLENVPKLLDNVKV
jgi:hypothetical protein